MGQCCSSSSPTEPLKKQNSSGSRRLSLNGQPQPVPDLPPNVNQDGVMGAGDYEMDFSCVSVAGTYFHPSMNPFKGNTKYKTNQDSFFIVEEFDGASTQYMGVLDGHGSTGHHASQFIARQLPEILKKKLATIDTNAGKAFVESFTEVDQQLADSNIDVTLSGSTCTTCLVRKGELIVANCGDSRCVLGYLDADEEWKSKDLSDDHKPDLPEEKKRIESTGGRVAPLESWPEGPKRVWLRHEDVPGLAMSRSLGDRLAHSVGVSNIPELMRHKLESRDRFIILASDGVWEFMSSEQVVTLVSQHLNPRAAAEAVCREAVDRWQSEEPVCDDITALVVFIKRK